MYDSNLDWVTPARKRPGAHGSVWNQVVDILSGLVLGDAVALLNLALKLALPP